jgi:hypothetical protein
MADPRAKVENYLETHKVPQLFEVRLGGTSMDADALFLADSASCRSLQHAPMPPPPPQAGPIVALCRH